MNPTRKKLIQRIDEIISKAHEAMRHPYKVDWFEEEFVVAFQNAAQSFIENTFGKEHLHSTTFSYQARSYSGTDIRKGVAILKNIREEIEGGWDITIRSLISGEIFSDFFDMANYLLDLDYKDPAAVIIGSILEGHLRQLCKDNEISIEIDKNGKKSFLAADQQNIELVKKEVYGMIDQKQVTAWLDIRNKAAHGHYGDYSIDQVKLMATGVMGFITRTS